MDRKQLDRLHEVAFWVLAAAVVVAAILTLLIFSGRIVSEEPQPPTTRRSAPLPAAPNEREVQTPAHEHNAAVGSGRSRPGPSDVLV
jgi:hypothetical protein